MRPSVGSSIAGVEGFKLTNLSVIEQEIKGNPDVIGAFPRWISLAQISNPYKLQLGDTGTFVIYGVSIKLAFTFLIGSKERERSRSRKWIFWASINKESKFCVKRSFGDLGDITWGFNSHQI